jgi:6-pyruvoyltetrahydropterin/6-carboxytetrahydropterin synthase
MYELSVEREFSAAHAIMIAGQREEVHGHNWRVSITVRGQHLDRDGLLCDFHILEKLLDDVVSRYRNRNLNSTPPFDKLNPTAEHVAQHIAQSVQAELPSGVRLHRVSVTEAPGCVASYVQPRRQ